jgi:2',3'-cyclic-nucleotide 2'-phosphodiesterase (5'-nucleotidase family)
VEKGWGRGFRIAPSFLFAILLLTACAKKQYEMKSATGYLVEMNSRFDIHADQKMPSLIQPYKTKIDTKMNEVIGEATQSLTKLGKQSTLANFTADAMQEYAKGIWGTVDFAVMNNGGLRTTLNQGTVRVSNMFEIYPFENQLVLLELPGTAVKQLFQGFIEGIVKEKVNGFSKNVFLTLKNNAIESLTINGKPLDEKATYRIATIDYLAEGNDGMKALTQATHYTDSNILLRDAMIEYIKRLTAENKKIHEPDNRIEIKD